jgi:hypothetical protein
VGGRADESSIAPDGSFDLIPLRRKDARKTSSIDLCQAGLKKMDSEKPLLAGYPDQMDGAELGTTVVFAKTLSIGEFERGKRLRSPGRIHTVSPPDDAIAG